MDFLLAWLGILLDVILLPVTFANSEGFTGIKYFLFVFGFYSAYLFAIAFGIALFQMPFKGSDYRDDYC